MGEEDSLYTKIPVSVTTEKVFNQFVNSDKSQRKYFIQIRFYRKKILKNVISLFLQDIQKFISYGTYSVTRVQKFITKPDIYLQNSYQKKT